MFSRGDGHDVIDENGYYDTDVVQIEGYAPSEVILSRALDVADDLVIRFTNGTDELRIVNTLDSDIRDQIEQIQFTDGPDGAVGTVWAISEVMEAVLANSSSAGPDILYGYPTADTLVGGLGNDRLHGNGGAAPRSRR